MSMERLRVSSEFEPRAAERPGFFPRLAEAIGRMMEREKVGEGKAGMVFNLDAEGIPLCVKIWHPELEALPLAELNKRQSLTTEEEFDVQDELHRKGFRTALPIAYLETSGVKAMIMERIKGYTLQELIEHGAKITGKTWRDLEKLGIEMNLRHNIAHRDLHPGNIMLRTEQNIETEGDNMTGELYIIDFGNARHVLGRPTPEDYILTIGDNVIKYNSDQSSIEALRPRRGDPDSSPFRA